MNILKTTAKITPVFLAIVSIAGTFAAISPSFIIELKAQAETEYGYDRYEPKPYPPEYEMNDNYKKSYEKDSYESTDYRNTDKNYNSYEPDYGIDSDKKPQIFPANKVAELGDRWWQWAIGIDKTVVNPFTADLGQAGCDVGLQDDGRLLFLGGAPRDPHTGDFPVHECVVKKGTSILFPILNVACNNLAVDTPFFGANEQDQRICANKINSDATLFDALHVNIDGIEVQNLEQYRIDSPAGGFEFTAVQNNVFDTPVDDGNGVSDSFWILLEDLKSGKHTISFSGAIDLDNIPPRMGLYEVGATYNLDVKAGYY